MLGMEWAIEVKMARLNGDNGKPDDTAFKDILSPYESDRSALTDCEKLVGSELGCRFGMLIYGFEGKRPLEKIIEEFEAIARTRVGMSRREVQEFGPLVHPVFARGRVFGWKLFPKELS